MGPPWLLTCEEHYLGSGVRFVSAYPERGQKGDKRGVGRGFSGLGLSRKGVCEGPCRSP